MRTNNLLLLLVAASACTNETGITPAEVNIDPGEVTECDFTLMEETDFLEYDCNPVFQSTGEEWAGDIGSIGFHTTQVSGHPFYQMWYTADATSGAAYELGYAISGDGTNWDTHPGNPMIRATPGTWDQDAMDALQVIWDEDESLYVMTYQGITLPQNEFDPGQWGIGVATSDDGIRWGKHPANPVIDFNDPAVSATVSPCWPLNLTKRAGSYISYVAASDPLGGMFGNPRCDVYTAVGNGLADWNFSPNPSLQAGDWYDAAGIVAADVVEFNDQFYMFYIGFESWTPTGQGNVITATSPHVAMATSPDGSFWTKYPGNPLPLSKDIGTGARAIGAEVVGTRVHLWVNDYYTDLEANAVGYFLFDPNRDEEPVDAPTEPAP
ncbi:MAG: hypothetical protein ACJAZO_004514 [Myxococcota bacterium]|jgi:hypothetical protein